MFEYLFEYYGAPFEFLMNTGIWTPNLQHGGKPLASEPSSQVLQDPIQLLEILTT